MPRPQLILSVLGGTNNGTLPHQIKKSFKSGLIKAAAFTNAWIITDDTNKSIMRLVGEAMRDDSDKYNNFVPAIGITDSSKFQNLERYCSHFILIKHQEDSNIVSEFRLKLESGLKNLAFYQKTTENAEELPVVLIVFQGDMNTLFSIAEYIREKFTILIIEVCAQHLINLSFNIKYESNNLKRKLKDALI